MEYTGTVKKVMDAVRITEKFRKREFVVCDASDKYPQTILFELANDRCEQMDNIKEGDKVTVEFNLKGREWTNPKGEVKYFNVLGAFKVTLAKTGEGKSEVRQAPKQGETFVADNATDLLF